MYLNFGDLGQSAKDYVEQYASKRQGNQEMNSIADMKRFVEEYPEFRKLSSNVTKHITLVGELSRCVGQNNLLDVSELEQSLACNDNHAQDVKVCNHNFLSVGCTLPWCNGVRKMFKGFVLCSNHQLRASCFTI